MKSGVLIRKLNGRGPLIQKWNEVRHSKNEMEVQFVGRLLVGPKIKIKMGVR